MVKRKKIRKLAGLMVSVCMISGIAAAPINTFADTEPDLTIIVDDSQPSIENNDVPYGDITFEVQVEQPDGDVPDDENTPTDTEEPETEEYDSVEEGGGIAGQFNEYNREVKNPARNIRLKVPARNDLVIGDTFQILYSFSPLKSDDYVTFKSYSKNVVQVDENGLVTAVGFGTARVRLESSKGLMKNLYFTVTDREGGETMTVGEAESIDFADQSAVVRKGKEYQIEPIIFPLGITDELTYVSNDKSVATVSKTGLIKAVGAGTTTITVTASNGVSAEFTITVYIDVLKGIDVSKWQGDIDWAAVSESGIDYVMIRSSFGCEDADICLKKNVAGCEKYGIEYGFYHYTYAKTASEAKKEAKFFLSKIKNYDPTYPIVLDIEEEFYKKMSRKKVTDIIVSFMSVLEDAGYYATLYSSPNFLKDHVDFSRVERYDIWIACWGDEERLSNLYDGHYGMWQYSCKGSVDGINGDVDLNYAFKDYSGIIKRNGLNGQTLPSDDEE